MVIALFARSGILGVGETILRRVRVGRPAS
jgi:hypothetical protein